MRFSYTYGSPLPSLFIAPLAVWMAKASLMILLLWLLVTVSTFTLVQSTASIPVCWNSDSNPWTHKLLSIESQVSSVEKCMHKDPYIKNQRKTKIYVWASMQSCDQLTSIDHKWKKSSHCVTCVHKFRIMVAFTLQLWTDHHAVSGCLYKYQHKNEYQPQCIFESGNELFTCV